VLDNDDKKNTRLKKVDRTKSVLDNDDKKNTRLKKVGRTKYALDNDDKKKIKLKKVGRTKSVLDNDDKKNTKSKNINRTKSKSSPRTRGRLKISSLQRGKDTGKKKMKQCEIIRGVRIDCDPPRRSVQLIYNQNHKDWASVIGLDCPNYGPLLHSSSKFTIKERELYCESFVDATLKWDICPTYLKDIIEAERLNNNNNAIKSQQTTKEAGEKGHKPINYDIGKYSTGKDVSGRWPRDKKIIIPERKLFLDHPNEETIQQEAALGPRLLDAVAERAKQCHPRVIAIGDVHGCIDELQDLLRRCNYQPGDLVVFLGDLVCKGPDSVSVIQLAREIGALGVRGNHDFEVIRWAQAIQVGVKPPKNTSEHYRIASRLSQDDVAWLHNLPWYISSRDLGTLFVHAGFVAGIRLANQNPRLMMNMRSILPDGTVTSKSFSNWPWSRLWDGPQTVLFGHDADRGLQQNEHAIGLDTGCVYGGSLTACILPEKRLVSIEAKRKYRHKSK